MYSPTSRFLPNGSIIILYVYFVVGVRLSTLNIWLVSGFFETINSFVIPETNFIFVDTLLVVEKEMSIWVSESGVMRGVLVSSEAFILVSFELFTSFIRLGRMVTDVNRTNKGIITAKAVFRGMPQSL